MPEYDPVYIPVYGLRMPNGSYLSQYGEIRDRIQAFFALCLGSSEYNIEYSFSSGINYFFCKFYHKTIQFPDFLRFFNSFFNQTRFVDVLMCFSGYLLKVSSNSKNSPMKRIVFIWLRFHGSRIFSLYTFFLICKIRAISWVIPKYCPDIMHIRHYFGNLL